MEWLSLLLSSFLTLPYPWTIKLTFPCFSFLSPPFLINNPSETKLLLQWPSLLACFCFLLFHLSFQNRQMTNRQMKPQRSHALPLCSSLGKARSLWGFAHFPEGQCYGLSSFSNLSPQSIASLLMLMLACSVKSLISTRHSLITYSLHHLGSTVSLVPISDILTSLVCKGWFPVLSLSALFSPWHQFLP